MARLNGRCHEALVGLLIAARKSAGMTQTRLAQEINHHQSWVARLEGGQRRIKVDELVKLGTVIGFDPALMLRIAMTTNVKSED
jgi:ribosome-binding protein aMBF1 (putative translation factor)